MDPPNIFVAVEYGLAYGRAVARGVLDYARIERDWVISLPHPSDLLAELDRMEPDGIIVQAKNRGYSQALRDRGIPAVNVADGEAEHPIPCVFSDHQAVGAAAAEHLLACGLRQFAYCGPVDHWYSQQRRVGFENALKAAGIGGLVGVLEPPMHALYGRDAQPWLADLPRPVGVLVANDHWAGLVIQSAVRSKLRVPEDVAVIGVDNDELLCDGAEVPLSSVAVDGTRIGAEAARILERLMAGGAAADPVRLIPPLHVVPRQSTDLLAIEDPIVADAVRFIRAHLGDSISVESILDHMTISRRQLEKRFQEALGRSPAAEIRRLRVERARQLIHGSDFALGAIAGQCGFNDVSMLGKAFRRETGLTPSQYRRRHGKR
jgi:LacI family transcriptional regulator